MFLDVLMRRNQPFLDTVIALHREQRIPANAYALDLDAVEANARVLASEGARHGLEVLAMTKQVGRAPAFMDAVRAGGIAAGVAVDMQDARALRDGGLAVGHIGHLVQVPQAEAAAQAPAVAGAEQRGVIAYPPAFFADARPVNAYDMEIGRAHV